VSSCPPIGTVLGAGRMSPVVCRCVADSTDKKRIDKRRSSLINPDNLTIIPSQVASVDYSLLAISGKRLTQTLKMGLEKMS